MYEAEITAAASAIYGEGSELLGLLCAAASEELEGRLRPGVAAADCAEAFITAAALLAVSTYGAACAGGGFESFRAGSVSVTTRGAAGGSAGRESLRRHAEAIMSPFIEDDGFRFTGVDG